MALKTTRRRTRAALGTDADDTDAAVDVKLQKNTTLLASIGNRSKYGTGNWSK